MTRIFMSPRFLMPLMVLIGMAVLGLRVGDVWDSASNGQLFARSALAQTKPDAAPAPVITPPALATPDAAKAADAPKPADADAGAAAAPADEDVSPAEMDVLKQLSARREEIDKRGKDLDTREALLKVAEQRVDAKIKEMETLRAQLQTMVDKISEGQGAQTENLVKVYETMKPEDAAKIFDALDMPILLNVIQRMKPKVVAPIMAKMSSEKAKEVTVALTKQDQLPQIK